MPNHITNVLDVTGLRSERGRFLKKVYKKSKGEDCIDFNATVPMPKELEDSNAPNCDKKLARSFAQKYGATDWYEWKCKNWGTKWGAYDACPPAESDAVLRLRFNTAWCMGTAWTLKTSKLFPTLTFTTYWIDEGGGAGKSTIKNGAEDHEDMSDHDWRMEFDESYREEYEGIVESPYGEFRQTYLIDQTELDWYDFEKAVVERTLEEDLPLLVGLIPNFNSGEAKILAQNRLKGD